MNNQDTSPVEMIICRNRTQAREIQEKIPKSARKKIHVIPCYSVAQIAATFASRITVLPGVDMGRDLVGLGTLRDILNFKLRHLSHGSVLLDLSHDTSPDAPPPRPRSTPSDRAATLALTLAAGFAIGVLSVVIQGGPPPCDTPTQQVCR